MKVTTRHVLATDARSYWELFFDDPFTERLVIDGLGCDFCEISDQRGDLETSYARTVRSGNRIDAPGPVRKVVGDRITFRESGTWSAGTGRWVFRIEPEAAALAGKVGIEGSLRLEPRGEGSIERICDVDIAVRIRGIGGLIEKFIVHHTRQSQDRTADFTRDWLARR